MQRSQYKEGRSSCWVTKWYFHHHPPSPPQSSSLKIRWRGISSKTLSASSKWTPQSRRWCHCRWIREEIPTRSLEDVCWSWVQRDELPKCYQVNYFYKVRLLCILLFIILHGSIWCLLGDSKAKFMLSRHSLLLLSVINLSTLCISIENWETRYFNWRPNYFHMDSGSHVNVGPSCDDEGCPEASQRLTRWSVLLESKRPPSWMWPNLTMFKYIYIYMYRKESKYM